MTLPFQSGMFQSKPTVSRFGFRPRKSARNKLLAARNILLAISCLAILFVDAGVAVSQTKSTAPDAKTKSKVDRSRVIFREPPMPQACQKLQAPLINMLVLGDSILWGQGLKEENKISFRVQNWICTETGRPVKIWREAHSGAVLKVGEPEGLVEKSVTKEVDAGVMSKVSYESEGTAAPGEERLAKVVNGNNESDVSHEAKLMDEPAVEFNGEINVDRPTIPEQMSHALTHFKGPEVDLVLMDGCINDFGFTNFINASMTNEQIDKRASAVCYDRMRPVLDDVAVKFPNARIVVTGYYPVITEQSAKNVFFRYLFGRFFSKEKQKWFFPNAKKQLFQKLIALSNQWTESSNKALQRSIAEANEKAGNRIAFAPANHNPHSGFGSIGSGFAAPKKTSLLWTSLFNSTGRKGLSKFLYVLFVLNFHALRANDEVVSARGKACDDAPFDFFQTTKCQLAAYGHPNKKGVDQYVETVTREVRRFLETSDWLRGAVAAPGKP